MTSPSPGPRPFPVAGPVHPLDYWLSPELARISPSGAPSRLRQLADAQGARAAAWSSAVSGGILMVLTGVFFSAITGNLVVILTLGPLGAALTILGLFSWNRVRASLPDTNRLLISRPWFCSNRCKRILLSGRQSRRIWLRGRTRMEMPGMVRSRRRHVAWKS